jgi:very-short-patch-repair endonuclease
MAPANDQPSFTRVLAIADRQHGLVTADQLRELGLTAEAIRHRRRTARLHTIHPGVYAVGTPRVSRHGRWLAAVLACGDGAALSHSSAAGLLGLRPPAVGPIHVSVPPRRKLRRRGVRAHRRARWRGDDVCRHEGIPVTGVVLTLVDIAVRGLPSELERAVNEADRLDLVDPETLRAGLVAYAGVPGVAKLRAVLDRHTFLLTDSELERRFLPIARRVGLPLPRTGARVNGFKVDFYWPELALVVETDGLRYHRTSAQQAADRRRDQIHFAAGMRPLRFTHAEVAYEPGHVAETLRRIVRIARRTPVLQ